MPSCCVFSNTTRTEKNSSCNARIAYRLCTLNEKRASAETWWFMSSRITPLCVRHWDSHESAASTDVLRRYEMTSGERTEVFGWVNEVIAYKRVGRTIGEKAKQGISCYLRNYGLRREWWQGLAAMCLLFYEKLEDSSVLRLSLSEMQRLCDFQYTITVLRRLEMAVVAMHFNAQESTLDD